MAGDEDSPNPSESEPHAGRSGPDKPWRNRKRRTSADIERDRLVDEVMRESRLDIYDEPEEEVLPDDQAADDRIAEKFRQEDVAQREKVDAKNHLEGYIYNLRNTINDEKWSTKIDADSKKQIEKAISDTQKWIDSNENAEKDEFEARQKEVEGICMPIMQKMYAAGGEGGPPGGQPGGGMPGGMPGGTRGARTGTAGGGDGAPRVDEVD